MPTVDEQLAARGVRIVDKRSTWHQRAIDRGLRVISLGRMTRYLDGFVTTIGHTIYVPSTWASWSPEERQDVLRHELVHVAQFERLGVPLMALLYLLVPLPVGLAWFRARLEKEAYAETLRAAFERGGRPAAEALRPHVIQRFTGPEYLWMWPFPRSLDRWFTRTLDQLASGRV